MSMNDNIGTLQSVETRQSFSLDSGQIILLNEISREIKDNNLIFKEHEDDEPERAGYSHILHFSRYELNGKMRKQNDPFSNIGFVPLLNSEEYELFLKNTPYCMQRIELEDGSLCIVVLNRFYLPVGVDKTHKYKSNDELVALAKASGIESIVFDDTDKKHIGGRFNLINDNNLTLSDIDDMLLKSTPFSKLSLIIAIDHIDKSDFYHFYKTEDDFMIDNIYLFLNIDFVCDVIASYYGDDCYRIDKLFCSWHKLFSSVLFKSITRA